MKIVLGSLSLATLLALAAPAHATCSIHNDTGWAFTVESGNVSNQSVGSHTQTSIAPGRIIGKSKEGKTVSGSCKDGDRVEIVDDHGVPVLTVK